MLANSQAEFLLAGRLGKPARRLPVGQEGFPEAPGGALPDGRAELSEAMAGLCPTARPLPIPAQRRRFRKLVTNRALWHSGGPIRRAGGPRGFRDLGFLRTRGARRAGRRSRACHRARFVTNLRAAPAEPPPAGPCQWQLHRKPHHADIMHACCRKLTCGPRAFRTRSTFNLQPAAKTRNPPSARSNPHPMRSCSPKPTRTPRALQPESRSRYTCSRDP